jgi:hypothetical protein
VYSLTIIISSVNLIYFTKSITQNHRFEKREHSDYIPKIKGDNRGDLLCPECLTNEKRRRLSVVQPAALFFDYQFSAGYAGAEF